MNEFSPKLADRIFSEALDLPEADRDAFIERECQGHAALKLRLEKLLAGACASDENANQFDQIRDRVWRSASGAKQSAAEDLSGERIGHWLLEKQLARGGSSTVYLARRDDGEYDQRVALKVLRRGLDTDDIVARFHAERQILSTLDHPAIARIIDGGAITDGRPYLVLEYVNGDPISEYCQQQNCSEADRIHLIIDVLGAIALAHSHLVVHRDIKPSNILVSAEGRVSLLDFGIAKLLDPDTVPGVSMQTRQGVSLLTPGYASPEQLAGERISTASDIYQVGRVLRDLLNNRHASGDPTLEDTRAIKLPVDLAAILDMAMHPDADRRYLSAGDMVDDLRRYLDKRPVRARPDTLAYRFRKLVGRRPWLIPAIGLVVFTLSGYMVTLIKHNQQLKLEQERATTALEFMLETLRTKDPFTSVDSASGSGVTISEALDFGVQQLHGITSEDPELRLSLLNAMAEIYASLDQHLQAIELREAALELERTLYGTNSAAVVASLSKLATQYKTIGNYARADGFFSEQLTVARAIYPPDHPELGVAEAEAGWFESRKGNFSRSESLLRSGISKMRSEEAQYALPLVNAMVNLVRVQGSEAHQDNMQVLKDARRLADEFYGNRSALSALVLTEIGSALSDSGDYTAAEEYFNAAILVFQQVLGRDHGETLAVLRNLGVLYQRRGEFARAENLHREVLEHYLRKYGAAHRGTATGYEHVATAVASQGRLAEAEPLFQLAFESNVGVLGEQNPEAYWPLLAKVWSQLEAQAYIDAERQARSLIEVFVGLDSAQTLEGLAHCLAGMALEGQGRMADGRTLRLAGRGLLQSASLPAPYTTACGS